MCSQAWKHHWRWFAFLHEQFSILAMTHFITLVIKNKIKTSWMDMFNYHSSPTPYKSSSSSISTSSSWFSSSMTSNISGGHWASFSAATSCTLMFRDCAWLWWWSWSWWWWSWWWSWWWWWWWRKHTFPRDLISRWRTLGLEILR